ncbi:hypothetical protein B188_06980 [Candidatus Brocadiaceae bacterium B188]|nr:hypothetical protein B188_06980 [Candidatus Brocadiaceae bacterium B188]
MVFIFKILLKIYMNDKKKVGMVGLSSINKIYLVFIEMFILNTDIPSINHS